MFLGLASLTAYRILQKEIPESLYSTALGHDISKKLIYRLAFVASAAHLNSRGFSFQPAGSD
jgi:hypothetical protein